MIAFVSALPLLSMPAAWALSPEILNSEGSMCIYYELGQRYCLLFLRLGAIIGQHLAFTGAMDGNNGILPYESVAAACACAGTGSEAIADAYSDS